MQGQQKRIWQWINISFSVWTLPSCPDFLLYFTPLHCYLCLHFSLTQARINSENTARFKDSLNGTSKQISPNIGSTTFLKCQYKCTLSLDRFLYHWRTQGGVWGFKPPPPKFRSFEKAWPNSQFRGIYICNNLIRIRVSLIYKLSETPN
jgi:hypothetical protein